MKLLKTSILTLGTLFAMSSFAGAETVVPTVGQCRNFFNNKDVTRWFFINYTNESWRLDR